jgi:hypothetical protein
MLLMFIINISSFFTLFYLLLLFLFFVRLFIFYPTRIPQVGSQEYIDLGLDQTQFAAGGDGN